MSDGPMFKRNSWSSVAGSLVAGILLAVSAMIPEARAEERPRTMSLSATGTVFAKPDTAHISTGVVSDADTARSALDQNSAAMKRVISELKEQGLKPEDIQTTNFSVSPRYQHFKDNRPPKLIGYRVNNAVRIRVKDLKKLGAILDTVVTLGSNRIGGISFSISGAEELLDKARADAMTRVIARARLYAEAASVQLGEIVSIRESNIGRPPRPMMARAAFKAAEAVPIEAGEQSLQVRVDVSWEID